VPVFLISSDLNDFVLHVYDTEGNDMVQPILVTPSFGWFKVYLNVIIGSDFFIAIEFISDSGPFIGEDLTSNQEHSYTRDSSKDSWNPVPWNFMIRAVVCEPVVGGELVQNSSTSIGPLLIAGISIITITIGITYKKRRNISSLPI
jgi:hypothetical protein